MLEVFDHGSFVFVSLGSRDHVVDDKDTSAADLGGDVRRNVALVGMESGKI